LNLLVKGRSSKLQLRESGYSEHQFQGPPNMKQLLPSPHRASTANNSLYSCAAFPARLESSVPSARLSVSFRGGIKFAQRALPTLLAVIGGAFMLVQPSPALVFFGPFYSTGNMATKRVSHTTTLLPNGKVLVTGGVSETGIVLITAELYDPATGKWAPTRNNLATARTGHTATLLTNGNVLVVGGYDGSVYLKSAEVFDTATGLWIAAGRPGTLSTGRTSHTATLLPGGKVLVAGGYNPGFGKELASAELYDPTSKTWSVTGELKMARSDHTTALLDNGKVLVAGGLGSPVNFPFQKPEHISSEIYDPQSGTWTLTAGALNFRRAYHSMTALRNGKVLLSGGYNASPPETAASAELFDPASGNWTMTGSLATSRSHHTGTLLPNGKVLVTGGSGGSGGSSVSTAELFDPAGNAGAGSWSPAGTLVTTRTGHTATLLANAKVLIAGGADPNGVVATSEFYDNVGATGPGSWSSAANSGNLTIGRQSHTSTLLFSGLVLTTGGYAGSGYAGTSELYNPTTRASTDTGHLKVLRLSHTATLLPDGNVLVTGGVASTAQDSCELYNPTTASWTSVGNLNFARYVHTATLLPSGKVLVTGGAGSGGLLASAEIYDPATRTWGLAAPMISTHFNHTATLLPGGMVLVAGGGNATAELYDPLTNEWIGAGDLTANRQNHTATLLPNGAVLVAGGIGPTQLASAELYDPASKTWAATGGLAKPRAFHTATLLSDGKVLAAGGTSTNNADLVSAEMYDPQRGVWWPTASIATARGYHTAVVLPDGHLLIAGGRSSSSTALTSIELYDRGLGYSPGQEPLITLLHFTPDFPFSLTGLRFKGMSEASGGSSSNSASNYPLVQIRNLDNGEVAFLPPGSWSDTSFTALPVGGLPFGPAMVTIFTNGIPSASKLLLVGNPPAGLTYSQNPATYNINQAITNNVPSNVGGAVISYSISPALPAGLNFNTATGVISGTPTALSPATNYTITAGNSGGTTTAALTVAVTKASQVITFTTIAGKTYGDADFLLDAAASSGLKVGFTIVSGPGLPVTVNGTMGVHLIGAGVIIVRASQFGNSNYDAAPSVDQTFTVAPAASFTSLTSSSNPSKFGQNVLFLAHVAGSFSQAGDRTGTIQFKDNGANLGSPQTLDLSGSAFFATTLLTSGTHAITAEYSGDANFNASAGTLSGGQVVSPAPGILGNVSTRLQVGTGSKALFAGFIVQGNAPKKVLIRSAGPSLAGFGVPGTLANPQMELHDTNSTIGTNDNWQVTQIGGIITSDQAAEIQASGVAPGDPAEPAIIATLSAGSYTAIVNGVNATEGVATVELYDLTPNNGSTLANISTRGFIQTGDGVMIGGFIVLDQPLKVFVRATGPSLVPLGIDDALANPQLELHDANGTLGGNDDWQITQIGGIVTNDQSSDIQNSGLAPSNPAESAIIATLGPGSYTAIARGADGGKGIGLIEVYALKP
jgi:hypothetical protein